MQVPPSVGGRAGLHVQPDEDARRLLAHESKSSVEVFALAEHGRGPAVKPVTLGYALDAVDLRIVRAVARGFTNLEVGRQVNLSPNTVKARLVAIGQVWGDGHRAAIVAEAMRRGLIE